MAFRYLTAVRAIRGLQIGQRALLYTLADYANEDGVSWVLQKTLAEDLEVSPPTISRLLKELIGLQILVKEGRVFRIQVPQTEQRSTGGSSGEFHQQKKVPCAEETSTGGTLEVPCAEQSSTDGSSKVPCAEVEFHTRKSSSAGGIPSEPVIEPVIEPVTEREGDESLSVDELGRPKLSTNDLYLIDGVIRAAGFSSDHTGLRPEARDAFRKQIHLLQDPSKYALITGNIRQWRDEVNTIRSCQVRANHIPAALAEILDGGPWVNHHPKSPNHTHEFSNTRPRKQIAAF